MDFKDLVTKSILQVRRECAFFGALMLFAKIIPSEKIETAATNGKTIFINESFFFSLNSSEQNALLLHEVLHMALLHCIRIGSRDRLIWNIAADIVVNGLIKLNTSFQLPKGAIIDDEFIDESAEEIYESLLKNKQKIKLSMPDIIEFDENNEKNSDAESNNGMDATITEQVESYWRDAIQVVQALSLIHI